MSSARILPFVLVSILTASGARAQSAPGLLPPAPTIDVAPGASGFDSTKGREAFRAHSVWDDLVFGTVGDARRLPSRETLMWLTVAGVGALASRPADTKATSTWSTSPALHETLAPGKYVGSTPIQLGASLLTYGIGRAVHSDRTTNVAADLVRGQLIAEALTIGLKQSTRRNRPQGTGFSFPSGHTTVSFTSATVLQRHFGWKVGLPAYAIAGYVGASRVQMKRHNLSDVAFGAALGIAAGRTVTIGRQRGFTMEPLLVTGGGGASFRWFSDRAPGRAN
jgi:hypothetical protein